MNHNSIGAVHFNDIKIYLTSNCKNPGVSMTSDSTNILIKRGDKLYKYSFVGEKEPILSYFDDFSWDSELKLLYNYMAFIKWLLRRMDFVSDTHSDYCADFFNVELSVSQIKDLDNDMGIFLPFRGNIICGILFDQHHIEYVFPDHSLNNKHDFDIIKAITNNPKQIDIIMVTMEYNIRSMYIQKPYAPVSQNLTLHDDSCKFM